MADRNISRIDSVDDIKNCATYEDKLIDSWEDYEARKNIGGKVSQELGKLYKSVDEKNKEMFYTAMGRGVPQEGDKNYMPTTSTVRKIKIDEEEIEVDEDKADTINALAERIFGK
jgi:hypothetical protein